MNFFVADVEQGFGGFVAFYLADLDWQPEAVGLVLTVGRIASAISLFVGGARSPTRRAGSERWRRPESS